ncbi:hypothetical protein [Flexibacterium corallicola]|nr:hypothetical protein [Pseudovibrio sp. M1P-2-3]
MKPTLRTRWIRHMQKQVSRELTNVSPERRKMYRSAVKHDTDL